MAENFQNPESGTHFCNGVLDFLGSSFNALHIQDMETAQRSSAPIARNNNGIIGERKNMVNQSAIPLAPARHRSSLPFLENEYRLRNLPSSSSCSSGYAATSSSSNKINNGYGFNIFQHETGYSPPVSTNIWRCPRIKLPVDNGTDYLPSGPRKNNVHHLASSGRGGRMVNTRRDEYDYRSLKKMIDQGDLIDIGEIIERTRDRLHELMFDRFGNSFLQSLFRSCHEFFINDLLVSMIEKEDLFIAVCLHDPGYRAVVRLMERLKTEHQKFLVVSVVKSHVVSLTSSFNGHNILRQCFQSFSQQENEELLLKMAENCVKIGMDKAGCCIMQNTISYAEGEAREKLVAPLIESAELLSQHCYGNYVIQYLLELGAPEITTRVIKGLEKSYVRLSFDKFGSNVVEKCLLYGESVVADNIISEIVETQHFFQLLTNEYGNYVAQRAIERAQGQSYNLLIRAVKRFYSVLQNHPTGKSVAAAIKRVEKSKLLH